MNRQCGFAIYVALFLVARPIIASAEPVFTVDDERVNQRARELRMEMVADRHSPQSDVLRETTVRALIRIVEEESHPNGSHSLRRSALRQLEQFPESDRGVEFLVKMIDFQGDLFVSDRDPLSPYPAANALVKVGFPARRKILSAVVGASDRQLHLMAHILARLDQTGDDLNSGPAIAIVRLQREIERKDQTVVDPEREVQKSTAIQNLRHMIDLLTDPAFMFQKIGPQRG